jgi:primosomal protein N' (replication factor Y)
VTTVAQVRVDVPVPHLDRVFDYAIPESLVDQVHLGSRVRVRFSGRLVNGFVVGLRESSEHSLRPIERVLGTEPVLTPDVLRLVERVAEHYAGSVHDVLRSAVPPRHARAERVTGEPVDTLAEPAADAWHHYEHGSALIDRIAKGEIVRAVWSTAPAHPWADDVAALVRSVRSGGVIVIAPDAHDVHLIAERCSDGDPALLLADHGPERRYRNFLRILRGDRRVVIGTRSAVFAPMPDLALIVLWGDGDDALWEPHAPYWNARDVAALRAHESSCSLVVGSPGRSTEAQVWCEQGWAVSIQASRETITECAPRVRAVGDDTARTPRAAWEAMKEGLGTGPVLVQVGRRGYLPRVACQQCRTPATCSCGGPMRLVKGQATITCVWCGAPQVRCATCGAHQWRAMAIGAERTAEEFGRAFPQTPIIWSAGDHIIREVATEPAIVVATPGAEPVCSSGYSAVVLLDARAALQRGALRAAEDAAYRWFSAAALARPQAPCVITADLGLPAVQALVRWNAPWLASREITDRTAAGMPPAVRMIALRGDPADVRAVADPVLAEVDGRLLGPVDGRSLLLVPKDRAASVISRLRDITRQRSLQRDAGVVTVIVDPREP